MILKSLAISVFFASQVFAYVFADRDPVSGGLLISGTSTVRGPLNGYWFKNGKFADIRDPFNPYVHFAKKQGSSSLVTKAFGKFGVLVDGEILVTRDSNGKWQKRDIFAKGNPFGCVQKKPTSFCRVFRVFDGEGRTGIVVGVMTGNRYTGFKPFIKDGAKFRKPTATEASVFRYYNYYAYQFKLWELYPKLKLGTYKGSRYCSTLGNCRGIYLRSNLRSVFLTLQGIDGFPRAYHNATSVDSEPYLIRGSYNATPQVQLYKVESMDLAKGQAKLKKVFDQKVSGSGRVVVFGSQNNFAYLQVGQETHSFDLKKQSNQKNSRSC